MRAWHKSGLCFLSCLRQVSLQKNRQGRLSFSPQMRPSLVQESLEYGIVPCFRCNNITWSKSVSFKKQHWVKPNQVIVLFTYSCNMQYLKQLQYVSLADSPLGILWTNRQANKNRNYRLMTFVDLFSSSSCPTTSSLLPEQRAFHIALNWYKATFLIYSTLILCSGKDHSIYSNRQLSFLNKC